MSSAKNIAPKKSSNTPLKKIMSVQDAKNLPNNNYDPNDPNLDPELKFKKSALSKQNTEKYDKIDNIGTKDLDEILNGNYKNQNGENGQNLKTDDDQEFKNLISNIKTQLSNKKNEDKEAVYESITKFNNKGHGQSNNYMQLKNETNLLMEGRLDEYYI